MGKLNFILMKWTHINKPRIINLFAVKWYGESEFWLSGGKVVLIFMLFGESFDQNFLFEVAK